MKEILLMEKGKEKENFIQKNGKIEKENGKYSIFYKNGTFYKEDFIFDDYKN